MLHVEIDGTATNESFFSLTRTYAVKTECNVTQQVGSQCFEVQTVPESLSYYCKMQNCVCKHFREPTLNWTPCSPPLITINELSWLMCWISKFNSNSSKQQFTNLYKKVVPSHIVLILVLIIKNMFGPCCISVFTAQCLHRSSLLTPAWVQFKGKSAAVCSHKPVEILSRPCVSFTLFLVWLYM